jgi:MioC protein
MLTILYGTESGNAEMAAEDLVEFIKDQGGEAVVKSMEGFKPGEFSSVDTAIIITSTYGEGNLPETTQPFYDCLSEAQPDLSGLRFAAFGLGDSTYEHFANAIDIVSTLLVDLGAVQVGDTGRHDAAKARDLSSSVKAWAGTVISHLSLQDA